MKTLPQTARPLLGRTLALGLAAVLGGGALALAAQTASAPPAAAPPAAPNGGEGDHGESLHAMPGMDGMQGLAGMAGMEGMGEHGMHSMHALLGPYTMTREASGTSWQPESSPHEGFHFTAGPWQMMVHGMLSLVLDHQGGRRGAETGFSSNMAMLMGSRAAGDGRLSFRAMVSAEPWTIGARGYPLLLQTGETADGGPPLVDRQHPHDLFMELAGVLQPSARRRQLRLRLRRPARRAGAGAARLHAPHLGDGQPRDADLPPLARFDPHQLRRRHRGLDRRRREARGLASSTAASPTSTAPTSRSTPSTPTPPASPGSRCRTGRSR